MTPDAEILVIGSGPAGVSAAFPLVEAGRRVIMVDGGGGMGEEPSSPLGRAFGADSMALRPDDELSPKWRTPVARRMMEAFRAWADIGAEEFLTVGALARGGLSRVWGGFVSEFDDCDLTGWPFGVAALRPSYAAVVARIGVSGSPDDHLAAYFGQCGPLMRPPPLGPNAALLLETYRRTPRERDFALGLARNALLTANREGRRACDLTLGCLWGCPLGAIYDARQDLVRLVAHARFSLIDGRAASLTPAPEGWRVTLADGRTCSAARVVLAAGALGTLRLVAPLLPDAAGLSLVNCPVAVMPLVLWRRLGAALPTSGVSLAQLGFKLDYGTQPGETLTGALYELAGLPSASFAARLPLGRRAATTLFGWLAPALLVATAYFPGHCSANRVTVRREADAVAIRIRGGVADAFPALRRSALGRLAAVWRRVGAHSLAATQAAAGTDAHFGGLFPMGSAAPHGTSRFGELNAATGLYLVDGSVLPSVPSKFTTLTIMANADRIGRHLAEAFSGDVDIGSP